MMLNNTLIICEKPAVGRDIAAALDMPFENKGGVLLASGNVAITWAIGHLLQEARPDEISDQWAGRWNLDSLPITPERIPLTVADGKAQQLRQISTLLASPDFDHVVCATDAGREGEHIYRCILRHARKSHDTAPSIPGKRQSRLWVKDCTKEGLKAAFRSLLPGQSKDSLAEAARARAEADYCVGMTMTRAVTVRADGQLVNVGRVISPSLRLLAERQQEHDGFRPAPFFVPVLDVDGFACEWVAPTQDTHLTRAEAQAILDAAQAGQIVVTTRKEGPDAVAPPLAFSLTALQRACNAAFGLTAAQTLNIAQALYETRKCVTYPRTDAAHISTALYRELDEVLGLLPAQYQECAGEARRHISALGREGKRPAVVDDAKLTDHHAIIPTRNAPRDLSEDEARVYDLIVRRFLASLMPAASYQSVKIVLDAGGHAFAPQSGMTLICAGWQAAMPETQRKEVAAPAWESSAVLVAGTARLDERKTKAPAIYTDGTLLAKLEALGLGTPATRAALIERLISTGFARREKKLLLVTPKGFETVRVLLAVVPDVTSPELTAEWEKRLADIEAGALSYGDFMASVRTYLRESVAKLRTAEVAFTRAAPEGVAVCPACKGKILDRPKFFGCASYRETGCTFSLPKTWGGKTLTPAIIRALCEKGATGYLKFKGQKGDYEARLILTPQDGGAFKIQPEFKQNGGSKGKG